MNNPLTLIGAVLVLILGVTGGLLYVANTMEPPQEQRQDIISDDQFPD